MCWWIWLKLAYVLENLNIFGLQYICELQGDLFLFIYFLCSSWEKKGHIQRRLITALCVLEQGVLVAVAVQMTHLQKCRDWLPSGSYTNIIYIPVSRWFQSICWLWWKQKCCEFRIFLLVIRRKRNEEALIAFFKMFTQNAFLKERYKSKDAKELFLKNIFGNSVSLPSLFQSLNMNIK